MIKSSIFDDKTILATPTPIHSSSISMDKQTGNRKNRSIDDSIERTSETNSSLGILSSQSMDSLHENRASAADRLHRERLLAMNSLNRCDANITSLPSRFLRPSEVSMSTPREKNFSFDSTISESDLIPPANSSTPRTSLLHDFSTIEQRMRERKSLGPSLSSLAISLDKGESIEGTLDRVFTTMNPKPSFCPGEEALEKFEQDELSWKKRNDIPVPLLEFSVETQSESKMSMGSFFQRRSDNVSELLAVSPEKNEKPVPLIESSSYDNDINTTDSDISRQCDSLSISTIAQILSDTKQTPTKAMNFFMQTKKIPKSLKASKSVAFCQRTEETANKDTENSTISQARATARNNDLIFMNPPILEEKEEFKVINSEACKENVDTLNVREEISPDFNHEKSVLSSRSSSSLSCLPNGKLPVATTKTELIWGCVKPGKNVAQEFIMKNKSSSRVGVKCLVSNPSFRLIKEGSDANFSSTLKVILHPYESRTFTVTFAPTALGAAVDNLYFSPINPNHTQTAKQFIRLCGYGGYGNITFNNVVKDTAGKFLLSLGFIESPETIKRSFTIKNNGTLPSFAYVGFVSNGLHLFTNLNVSPRTLILLPDEEKEVIITYTPKKEDRSYLHSKVNCSVIDIGKVTIIYGTEVDRGRLRRLYLKAKDKGLEIEPAFENLVKNYPGEIMPKDLKLLKEPISALDDIVRLINTSNIVITLEQDCDRTVIEQFQNETAMFHSLCENTKIDMFENTLRPDVYQVEPSKIILTPPGKMSDMIFLNNSNKKNTYFEVSSSPEGLEMKPNNGTVLPGETVIINLTYTDQCKGKTGFKVKVLVDNECYEVDVKVVYVLSNVR